jgi:hypothetical protein
MSTGWISLHRQSKEHWLYDCKPFDEWHAWQDILLSVNHEPRKVLFDGKLLPVNAGQMITSLSKLTEKWGWNRSKTRRFLELLQSDGMVELFRNKNGTLVTVVNWAKFQSRETQMKQSRNTGETKRDTNNNDNNENKREDARAREDAWRVSPTRLAELAKARKDIRNAPPELIEELRQLGIEDMTAEEKETWLVYMKR